jgi:hypothetical protein
MRPAAEPLASESGLAYFSVPMSTPANLSELRINRDAPPVPVRKGVRSRTPEIAVLLTLGFPSAFAFRVTPQLLLAGLVFAVVMGLVGGFFPAQRASKLPVIQALR